MLVLDTNVVRNLVCGDTRFVTFEPLEAFAAEGGAICLSEVAFLELVAFFKRNPESWANWRAVRPRFAAILSPTTPLITGGNELFASAGITLTAAREIAMSRVVRDVLCLRLWASIRTAESVADVRAEFRDAIHSKVYMLNVAKVAEVLDDERRDWVTRFAEMRADVEERGALFGPGDVAGRQHEKRCEELRAFLDRLSESDPRASVRLDAMVCVWADLSSRALLEEPTYNPATKKKRNDSLDYELLRCLGLPAAICTGDGKFREMVERSGTWQRAWLVDPKDLEQPYERERLRHLSWPSA